jgi:3-oxoacyl-[acyl-carrier protein] reductase
MTKQITLITGGTRGIGKQIGFDLLDKDHTVIFTGKTKESCSELSKELTEMSKYLIQSFLVQSVDFSYEGLTNDFCEWIKTSAHHIDNLILNVGATCKIPFDDMDIFEWEKVIHTNLSHPLFMIQKLKKMIKKNIIFIGSVLGHVPDSSSIAYGVSKGSLDILTKYLAKEFAPLHVNVNTVAPGFIETSWHDNKSLEQIERIKNKTLLKRFGTTKEVSHACQFIIENEYITGQTLNLDGGYGLV